MSSPRILPRPMSPFHFVFSFYQHNILNRSTNSSTASNSHPRSGLCHSLAASWMKTSFILLTLISLVWYTYFKFVKGSSIRELIGLFTNGLKTEPHHVKPKPLIFKTEPHQCYLVRFRFWILETALCGSGCGFRCKPHQTAPRTSLTRSTH